MPNAIAPPLTDSLPKVGPTTCWATILAGASNLPDCNKSDKS